jgi:hypothetical protein
MSNAAALHAMAAVRPLWTRVVAAREVVGRPARWLLHAGPPFRDPSRPSPTILNSAVLACLYEGWATTPDDAAAMIRNGAVALEPAQEHGVVLPLAAIASPRTTLVEVADAAAPDRRAWSLLPSGMAGPQIRFGTRESGVLERLTFRDDMLAPACSEALRDPVDLLALARVGLDGADDLHGRTTAATAALSARPLPAPLAQTLATSPLFFLTLWMAVCACIARALQDHPQASFVTALCGNGESVALRRADRPGRWTILPAEAPSGPLPPGLTRDDIAGVVGDSGIIDALGFGGQAIRSDEPKTHFGALLPDDHDARRALYVGIHPAFADLGLAFGLDATRVREDATPLVVIAMLRKTGGLAGRGLYRPPAALFR